MEHSTLVYLLYQTINYTDNIDMAEFLIQEYRKVYTYHPEITIYISQGDYNFVRINICNIKSVKMLQFLFKHSDIFMKPFIVYYKSKNHEHIPYIRKENFYNSPEENRKILGF